MRLLDVFDDFPTIVVGDIIGTLFFFFLMCGSDGALDVGPHNKKVDRKKCNLGVSQIVSKNDNLNRP